MGRSLKFLLPPTPQHFQNSAPFSSKGCLSHPLCQAKRLRHSQAWDLDKPAGQEVVAMMAREEEKLLLDGNSLNLPGVCGVWHQLRGCHRCPDLVCHPTAPLAHIWDG